MVHPRGLTIAPHPIKILVVDDHEENLLALEVILDMPGVELIKTLSGAEALRWVLREDFAAILLDVSMPGMDGFEVARLVKQRERSRHVPIIFLTAAITDIGSVYRGYEVGAVEYILKPLDPDVVRAKVAVFVELHRRGEEIRRQAALLREADRQLREAELAELRGATERRYRNLADAIPQIVWTADPAGAIVYFNQRWMSYTGGTLAAAQGSGWRASIHPDDAPRFAEQWSAALAKEEPFRAECRLRSSGGAYRWHLCEGLPEREDGQAISGWLGTFTDVEEQKQLDEARRQLLLREQLARADAVASMRSFEFLARASNHLTRSLDVAGILKGLAELATPHLCSWCVVDLLGADGAVEQAAFAHEDEARSGCGPALAERLRPPEEGARGVAGVIRSGQAEVSSGACDAEQLAAALGTTAVDVIRRLGAEAYLSAPLSARGRVLGAITLVGASPGRSFSPADLALAIDLGQRAALAVENARLYADAQRAIRIREEFLSIASHELRTPLATLELQVESLRKHLDRRPLDLERVSGKTVVAKRQVERLSRLISEMLDVSRIGAGQLELEFEDVDLGELLREVVACFAGELERSGCALELALAEGVVGRWDRARLDQLTTNLLHNAIKYGQGKPITITLAIVGAGPEAAARLSIQDRGIGIPAADQKRIFGRFERAVSSRAYGGMGVGLFIVDQIVRVHGGTIALESEAGRGATFTVTLRLRGAEEAVSG